MNPKLHLVLASVIVVFASSCSRGVNISVTDASSGKPVIGTYVEAYSQSTPDQVQLVDTGKTDSMGNIAFGEASLKDRFVLCTGDDRALSVLLAGQSIRLSPDTNRTSSAGWNYSFWIEDGTLQHSVWPLSK